MDFPKVELHVHLDGCLEHKTIWELLQKKNLTLPNDGSFQSLVDAIIVKEPKDLQHYLHGFGIFLPAIVGDLHAIERMAYEFCQYQSKENVIYAEVRYCPHLLIPDIFNKSKPDYVSTTAEKVADNKNISLNSIVEAVNRGLSRGETEFGIITRTILSCIRGMPQWSQEILDLCIQYKSQGVVGIDVAGNEGGEQPIEGEEKESRMLDEEDVVIFNKAAELGVRRTVHAGEAGPAAMVWNALKFLKAERIGHGYRVLEDPKIYQHCLDHNIHFECCPTSSILTGSVKLEEHQVHPIMRFAQDKASFSISTDDPTVTNTKLRHEYELLRKWGMTDHDFKLANINAMKSAFVEPEIKERLLQKLYKAYGMSDN